MGKERSGMVRVRVSSQLFLLAGVLALGGPGGGALGCSSTSQSGAAPADGGRSDATVGSVGAIIGANGGTVTSADGKLTITVPANALASDTLITIAPVDQPPLGGLGPAYEIGPTGTQFNAPVVLAFAADASWAGMSVAVATYARDGWERLPLSTADASGARALTTHLSTYCVVKYGDVCSEISPCEAPFQCVGGQCIVPCACTADCPSFLTCQGNRCQSLTCRSNADCQSLFGPRSSIGNVPWDVACNVVAGICTPVPENEPAECPVNWLGQYGCPEDTSADCGGCAAPSCVPGQLNACGSASLECAYGICWERDIGCRFGSAGCSCPGAAPNDAGGGGPLDSGSGSSPDSGGNTSLDAAADAAATPASHFHLVMPGTNVTIDCTELDTNFITDSTSAATLPFSVEGYAYAPVGGRSVSTGEQFEVLVPTSAQTLREPSLVGTYPIADFLASSYLATNSATGICAGYPSGSPCEQNSDCQSDECTRETCVGSMTGLCGLGDLSIGLAVVDSFGTTWTSCGPGECGLSSSDTTHVHVITSITQESSATGQATFRISGTFTARVTSRTQLVPVDATGDWSLLVTVPDPSWPAPDSGAGPAEGAALSERG